MNANLINLKQIFRGSELLEVLSKYSASKVETTILKATKVTAEPITTITTSSAILAFQTLVVDSLHKFTLTYDGETVDSELYTVAADTGTITFHEGVTFDLTGEHTLTVTYSYISATDNGAFYTLTEVIELIRTALADTSVIEDKIDDAVETINSSLSTINDRVIKDRVKLFGDIVPAVGETPIAYTFDASVTPEILGKMDKTKSYAVYYADNTPVMSETGGFVFYDLNTNTFTGTPSVIDLTTPNPEVLVYKPVTTTIVGAKIFPIGTFTFSTLPSDYLLDNDEFAAASYQAAIDKIVTDLAQDQTLLDSISALINDTILTQLNTLVKTTIVKELVVVTVTDGTATFPITHEPILDNEKTIIVNGLTYPMATEVATFDAPTKTFTWAFNSTANGFDLEVTDTVVVEYTYLKA